MAAVAPSSDRILVVDSSTPLEAADLLQKLSLDTPTKTMDVPEPTKKTTAESGNVTNGQIQDRSVTPLLPDSVDPTTCYYPSTYYYGGYDGTDWGEDYFRYLTPEGVDLSHGVYGDNGSIMYQHAYGYAPYSPYSPATSPVPTVGHDGQLYGAQQYQYPTPYFQPQTPTGGPYQTSIAAAKGEISTSATADHAPLSVDSANGHSNGIANGGGVKAGNGAASVRPTYQNSSYNINSSYGRGAFPGGMVTPAYQDSRYGFDGMRSPIPWLDGPIFSDGQHMPLTSNSYTSSVSYGNNVPSSRNQNLRPNMMGMHNPRPMSGMNTASGYTNGYMNRMYPTKLYGQYGNTYRAGIGYGSNVYDTRSNGRGWPGVDNKYKPRGRGNGFFGYGNDNLDGLNELNRGPRAKSSKNQNNFAPVALAVKGQNIPLQQTNDTEKENTSLVPDREQYNKADFPETYADAKLFIIKSYSEDDVHKSIKYNVWASTPNGNKKLDAAYQEAQQKSGGCPVFLFFSVNTSGQFVGVAEMLGPVDFNKNLEYWQQDKWVGCFPVRWHIVKDVPNSLLKHITLENNENKPVTNSRDTQEVKLEQGLQVLKIFKEHSSKQCILDDFEFYEERQKRILEKKAKQQLFQKQAWEGKSTDYKSKEGTNGELKSHKSSEVSSVAVKEATPAVQANGDVKVAENGSVVKSGEVVPKGAKPMSEKIVGNGVADGC